MKKHILISFLFFAGGLACGYLIQQMSGGPRSAALSPGPEQEITAAEQPTPQAPPSGVVLERVLPNASIAWLWADFKRIGEHKDAFSPLWKDDAVKEVADEFVAALPAGATQAFQALSGASDAMRLFFLPPPREDAHATWIAAFLGDHDTLSSLLSDMPDSDRETKSFGPHQIDVIKTPFGEFAVRLDDQLLWISTAAQELAGILNAPAPPDLSEKPALHEDALRRFPHTAVGLFMNSAHTIHPGPGAPGMAPQLLSHLGADSAYVVMHWPNGEGRLTAVAQSAVPPRWTSDWAPMKEFPFGADDPAGLLEIAFRRPSFGAVNPATDVAEAPNQPGLMRADRRAQKRRAQGNGNIKQGMSRHGMLNLLDMTKPTHIASFNLFGFYQGAPTMAFAFPQFETDGSLIERFQQMPGVNSDKIEIAKFPGTLYQIQSKKGRPAPPLDEFIAIERDATMYLFDSEAAASNYLGEDNTDPDGRQRRTDEARNLLSQVRSSAQAQAAISNDWFDFILRLESKGLKQPGPANQQFAELVSALSPHLKPAAVSAGFDGKEWFVDVYTENEPAVLIETLLAALHGYRWLNEEN